MNLSYLIDKLEELGQFDNIVASLNGGVGVIDSTVTLVDYTEDLVEDATNLDAYSQTYEERYTAFSDAVNDLIRGVGRNTSGWGGRPGRSSGIWMRIIKYIADKCRDCQN